MLGSLTKSLPSQVYERLASPLLGSFCISWSLWNYKFLVILFSANSVALTFKLLEYHAFPDFTTVLLRGVLYPLGGALAYIFIYPYPARFVYEFTQNRQREIADIRKRIEEETPLTVQESRAIRAELAKREVVLAGAIDQKDKEIDQLRLVVAELQSDATAPIPKPAILPAPELTSTELALLKLVEEQDGRAYHRQLLRSSGQTRTQTEFDLGELRRRKLVEAEYDSELEDTVYTFTHEGRRALVRPNNS